ncbi:MAG: hypothetical protein Q8M16_06195 [Pirellulaceae bacterium]|nr:hypothetical protein [Pirellulaceae bacterium]
MSQPSPKPADDLPPSGPDSGAVSPRIAQGPSSSRVPDLRVPDTVEDRTHRGVGDIMDWAAGARDEDEDAHDLADTVDVSSTVDELVVYLDGYLDDDQRRRVEQRLIEDESARENLAALQNSWDALDCLPRPTCSADFTESTMKLVVQKELAIRPTGKWVRRSLGWMGVAATLVFSLGMGFFVTQRWQSANEREFFESYRLVRDWEKYQLIGDFEFLLRLEKEGWFAREVPHVEP